MVKKSKASKGSSGTKSGEGGAIWVAGGKRPLVGLALLATPVARDVRRIFGMFINIVLLFHMARENYPCVDHFRIKHCLFPWLRNLTCGSPCPMLLFFFHGLSCGSSSAREKQKAKERQRQRQQQQSKKRGPARTDSWPRMVMEDDESYEGSTFSEQLGYRRVTAGQL